jgi:hypothetical protein
VATTRSTVPGDHALDLDAAGRARVPRALMAALDDAERVEGVHHRDAERARGGQRGDRRHPEVAVDDVGRLGGPLLAELVGEGVHVRQELVLRHVAGRAGVHVVTSTPGANRTRRARSGASRRVWTTTSSPRRPSAAASEATWTFLASRVDAAEDRERARVLGDHRDPHRLATSRRTASQSRRKRASP